VKWNLDYRPSSSSTVHISPSGLFPIRINLELRILYTVGRTLGRVISPGLIDFSGFRGYRAQKEREVTCNERKVRNSEFGNKNITANNYFKYVLSFVRGRYEILNWKQEFNGQ
jgi:hypothetical protein